jgi:hypothetical protein
MRFISYTFLLLTAAAIVILGKEDISVGEEDLREVPVEVTLRGVQL